jgi:hypothetical protein
MRRGDKGCGRSSRPPARQRAVPRHVRPFITCWAPLSPLVSQSGRWMPFYRLATRRTSFISQPWPGVSHRMTHSREYTLRVYSRVPLPTLPSPQRCLPRCDHVAPVVCGTVGCNTRPPHVRGFALRVGWHRALQHLQLGGGGHRGHPSRPWRCRCRRFCHAAHRPREPCALGWKGAPGSAVRGHPLAAPLRLRQHSDGAMCPRSTALPGLPVARLPARRVY